MNNEAKDLINLWGSLGIAYRLKERSLSSPEKIIIKTCNYSRFAIDKKHYSLMRLWLKHYNDLISTESLKKHIPELGYQGLVILYGISTECIIWGNRKWTIVKEECEKMLKDIPPGKIEEDFFLKEKGIDPLYKEINARIAKIEIENEKKLSPRSTVLTNPWLRNRLLFGVNLRSDIFTLVTLNQVKTAYQASKYLRYSLNSCYKNWNDIKEALSIPALT